MQMRVAVWGVAILGIAAGASSLALSGDESVATPPEQPVPVRTFIVGSDHAGSRSHGGDSASNAGGTSWPATLRYDREATLSFRVGGTLSAMPVRAGQRLERGALVAAIDPTSFAAGLTGQAAEVARLRRAASRQAALVPEGAVAEAQARDSADALIAAEAAMTAARHDLSATRLLMPFAGVVLTRSAEIGETMAAGREVVRVADLSSPLLATAQLPVAIAARLSPGTSASLTIPGQPGPVTARVLRIPPFAGGGSGSVPVDLTLTGARSLASGTPASVRLSGSDGDNMAVASATGYRIPAEALLDAQGDRATLLRVGRDGRARKAVVRFLGFDDRDALVAGLSPGQVVVTAGAGFVTDGQRVKAVAP